MKYHKIKYAAALLCAVSIDAHATLTSVDNGLGVYDSILDVTWTSDANLLGTMEADAQNLIKSIIDASNGKIFDNGNYYSLSASDFTTTGKFQGSSTWMGAQAFANYGG